MITVWIEASLVQDVTDLELGQEVRICDCDIDGAEFEELQRVTTKRRHRKYAYVSFWHGRKK